MNAPVNFIGKFFLWNNQEELDNQSPLEWKIEEIPEGLGITRKDLEKCGVPMVISLRYNDDDYSEEIWGANLDELLVERIKKISEYKDKIIIMKHPYYFHINYD